MQKKAAQSFDKLTADVEPGTKGGSDYKRLHHVRFAKTCLTGEGIKNGPDLKLRDRTLQ
jgi:hypothetical protein